MLQRILLFWLGIRSAAQFLGFSFFFFPKWILFLPRLFIHPVFIHPGDRLLRFHSARDKAAERRGDLGSINSHLLPAGAVSGHSEEEGVVCFKAITTFPRTSKERMGKGFLEQVLTGSCVMLNGKTQKGD